MDPNKLFEHELVGHRNYISWPHSKILLGYYKQLGLRTQLTEAPHRTDMSLHYRALWDNVCSLLGEKE